MTDDNEQPMELIDIARQAFDGLIRDAIARCAIALDDAGDSGERRSFYVDHGEARNWRLYGVSGGDHHAVLSVAIGWSADSSTFEMECGEIELRPGSLGSALAPDPQVVVVSENA
jgi:hypothetical protein